MPSGNYKPSALFDPAVLDRLRLVGVGTVARVFRHGPYAVKVAHTTPEARRRLGEEIDSYAHLTASGLPLPRLYCVRDDRAAFVRSFLRGPSLLELLRERAGDVEDVLLDQLWVLLQIVERLRLEHAHEVDFSPANLFVQPRTGRLTLADLGRRLDPPLFAGCDREGLRRGLRDYLGFRAQLERPDRLRPFLLPPSGRFGVEVELGRAPAARLLWVNEGLRRRLGLPWSRATIERLGALATHAPDRRTTRVASRYQDSPGTGEGEAQGDGRVVYLGEIGGGSDGRREITLKGCGPTPLAWFGHAYHFDGFVSFNRTLWETSICDELYRLGFETPEVLAIVDTGKTTVDNTEKAWPAAAAIRVARTHFRLGHLTRWREDPDALQAICRQIGRDLIRPDFDPRRPSHLAALVLNFAHNLGDDGGRTDALNIHCFNGTQGNLRADGHFIDFSTVRFQRYYLPGYHYLDGKQRVGDQRAILERYARSFAELFGQAGLLAEAQVERLRRRALRRYSEGYDAGFLDGLGRLLGGKLGGTRTARRYLVAETVHLRRLRVEAEIDFPLWKQHHQAPLFDLEGRAPELVAAWRRGERAPWMALRSEFPGTVSPFAHHVARAWFESLERITPMHRLRRLRPRRISQIVRPFMENRRLAALCYQRSRPEAFTEWQRLIATSRHLPEGRYDYFEARAEAQRLGHLALPGLLPHRYEVVVGLTEELWEGICDAVDEVVGDRLVGVFAYGSRVVTRDRLRLVLGSPRGVPPGGVLLREHGGRDPRTSDLNLKVLVRDGDVAPLARRETLLRQRLAALESPFPPVPRRHVPIIEHTPLTGLAEAAVRLVGRAGPASLEQAVALYDPVAERPRDAVADVVRAIPPRTGEVAKVEIRALVVSEVSRPGTGCPLTEHQLEICLRDRAALQPPAPKVQELGAGRFAVLDRAGSVVAASRAGRTHVGVAVVTER